MRHLIASMLALGLLLCASPALAGGADHPNFAITPHVGATAPQPFGDLESWPVFGADVGVILPFDVAGFERPIQMGFDASYTAPGAEGEGEHPMLGSDGADYQWDLQQRMLTVQFTTLWRFMPPGQGFSAHLLAGPRIYLMESVLLAEGNEGQDFGEHRETNHEYGFAVGAGAEYMLGPGAALGTLLFARSPLDQRITGEANTGAFNLSIGYRLFF